MTSHVDDYIKAYNDWANTHKPEATKIANDAGKQAVTPEDKVNKTSCAIPGGIGWIVCPVVNFLAWTADSAFSLLNDNFLKTNPAIFGDTTQAAWGSMRSIANVAFVIAFLIIIFSQITSVGITNYGIKKLLPRIIIAAILVNLSFIICQ